MLSCYQHTSIGPAQRAGRASHNPRNSVAVLGVPRGGTVPLGASSGLPCRPPLSPSLISWAGACLVSPVLACSVPGSCQVGHALGVGECTWNHVLSSVPGSRAPSHSSPGRYACTVRTVPGWRGQCRPETMTSRGSSSLVGPSLSVIGISATSVSALSVGQPWGVACLSCPSSLSYKPGTLLLTPHAGRMPRAPLLCPVVATRQKKHRALGAAPWKNCRPYYLAE